MKTSARRVKEVYPKREKWNCVEKVQCKTGKPTQKERNESDFPGSGPHGSCTDWSEM